MVKATEEPILLLEECMEMEKEELIKGYVAESGSSSGRRNKVDRRLHVLS